MLLYPFLFHPNLRPMVWGGNQLRPFKGLEQSDEPIGESWEVSALPKSVSILSNGLFEGQNLISVIDKYPVEILGRRVNEKYNGKLPLLVKFIDATRNLSIQVHPDDKMALRERGENGKNEMWYIIKSEKGGCLYSGFKDKISPEEYCKRVSDGTITDVLAKHSVKPGDVFYIPAGRIHSICSGVLLAEIQQSSDLTYRIYDYNRPGLNGKPRELHTELASKTLDYAVYDNYRTEYELEANIPVEIIRSDFFSVRLVFATTTIHRDLRKYDSFVISMCIEGECIIRVYTTGEEIILKQGSSTLIPAVIADYDVIPLSSSVRLLESFIEN